METVDVNKEIKIEVSWEDELLCDQKVANDDYGNTGCQAFKRGVQN